MIDYFARFRPNIEHISSKISSKAHFQPAKSKSQLLTCPLRLMTVRCGDYYTLQSERARAAHSGARALARQLRACARGCGGNGTRADLSARRSLSRPSLRACSRRRSHTQRNGRSSGYIQYVCTSNETQNFDQSSARPNLTQISSQSYPHPNLETHLIKV